MMDAASQPELERQSFWKSVVEALRGSRHNYTEGDLNRSILLLAIPMILEMIMESLFAIVDAFFVSSLGTNAVAAVALTESFVIILFGVAIGLSMATGAMVARRIGEKDPKAASIAATQAVLIGVFVAVPISITGVIFAPQLLRLMGGQPEVIEQGQHFARIIYGGSATIFLLFLNNAIFRGAGDAAFAMRALWISNIINIILNPCLILGLGPFPKLGLIGSAIGTTIGRGTGVLFQLWILFGGMARVQLSLKQMRIDLPVMMRLLRVSLNGMFQIMVSMTSWLGLVRITATFGSSALAGYLIAIRIIMFIILPAWGLCNAAATLVGQSLGAGKPERAEQAVYRAGFYNMIFMGAVAVIFIAFAESFLGVFSHEPEVVRLGSACLRTISYGYCFYAWGMVTLQAFNGAGDTWTPTLINLGCLWALQLPLGYTLAMHTRMGPQGVFAAIPIAQSMLALVGLWSFRRGKWKRKKI